MKLGTIDISKIYLGSTEVTSGYLGTVSIYTSVEPLDPTEPFYIKNPNNSAITVTIKKSYKDAPTLSIQYSSDKTTWTTLGSTSTSGLTISVPENSKMYFRCNTNYWYYNGYYNNFTATSFFNVGGNTMSLLYGSNFTGNETSLPSVSSTSYRSFGSLFENSVNLIDASRLILPTTTLAHGCYTNMFHGCTSLTTAPELPATTLANYCYYTMFGGCTGLTTAPELPATTLAQSCYANMLQGCTSLTTAPELPATTLAQSCYSTMFGGCTGLTTAPELPATTLANYCYAYMFNGCSSLNYIKCLATSISATNCTSNWVNGVSDTGTFVKNANMSSWTTGNNDIPSGWTIQNA